MSRERLRIAIPKGRLQSPVVEFFRAAGLDVPDQREIDSRRLVFTKEWYEWIFVKDGDVPTYVEFGAADAGVSGFDQILEHEADVYLPFEFPFGRCRMMLISTADAPPIEHCAAIATKYPRFTRAYMRRRALHGDVIALQGSVELAAVLNLSPWIIDLVETGETARIHGLVPREAIAEVAPRLAVNRTSDRLKRTAVQQLVAAVRGVAAEEVTA